MEIIISLNGGTDNFTIKEEIWTKFLLVMNCEDGWNAIHSAILHMADAEELQEHEDSMLRQDGWSEEMISDLREGIER